MKNEIVSLSLSTDSIIAIIGIVVTVLIAVIGGIYKIVTSTKKYAAASRRLLISGCRNCWMS